MTDLPRKFHIPSSELVPCEIGVNGLATCRTHEVDVRWIHSPDPADEERFINLTGTYLVVGGNDHIVKTLGCVTRNENEVLLPSWALLTVRVNRSLANCNLRDTLLSKKIKMAREIAQELHLDLSLDSIKLTPNNHCTLDLGTHQLQHPTTTEVTPVELEDRIISYGILLWHLCRFDYAEPDTTHYAPDLIREGQTPDLSSIHEALANIIKACWVPSALDTASFFSTIGNSLLLALLEATLESEDERVLWGRTIENEYDEFLGRLFNFCNVPGGKDRDDLLKKLKIHFFAVQREGQSTPVTERMSIEQFVHLLSWCGGGCTDSNGSTLINLCDNIIELCAKTYFFGRIHGNVAEGKLTNKENLCFLLRLSSGENSCIEEFPFTLSVHTPDKEHQMFHCRVALNASRDTLRVVFSESAVVTVTKTEDESTVQLLDSLIGKCVALGHLGKVCPGSPVRPQASIHTVYDINYVTTTK